ncbi:MAG: molecular chaperone DnaK [Kangiellaceae bacterium]|nr:molecular chaperone DnaK [Kangiellaceae bacterium]|tara:strand:- start:2226 stop:4913 length:2688 start_codon:yes stop_codon:yes gene_type:complete
MSDARYVIGIDLGTTHLAVSYYDIASPEGIQQFAIPQWVENGQWDAKPLLPAIRYHWLADEEGFAAKALPWPVSDIQRYLPQAIYGYWALELGRQRPDQLVTSAKSWLSQAQTTQDIALPWQAGDGMATISPSSATAGYLDYLISAWNAQFPDALLTEQQVVITIPASFDELARALTVQAIEDVGIKHYRLFEEPQAACYDYLHNHSTSALKDYQSLLVLDVGGGTTDFSLITIDQPNIEQQDTEVRLKRKAVGEHLMLGGDNMDLALAIQVQRKLSEQGKVDSRQATRLQSLVRQAKEALLADTDMVDYPITIAGRGSGLFGSTLSTRLTQKEVQQIVLDGFLPLTDWDDEVRKRQSGLVEWGLRFPSDPVISRHLSAFLRENGDCQPDAVLLNGGPFKSPLLVERIKALFAHWGMQPDILAISDPSLAVAQGACYFGQLRQTRRQLIEAGSARNYYVMAESGSGKKAVALLPKGQIEGEVITLNDPTFVLRTGQAARFEIASSTHGEPAVPGDVYDFSPEFHPLPALEAQLDGSADVQVRLSGEITEAGVLEIQCHALDNQRHWKLSFNLRQQATISQGIELKQAQVITQTIDSCFNKKASKDNKFNLRQLLEKSVGNWKQWDSHQSRCIGDALLEKIGNRRRSAQHERQWLNLTGYSMRPGVGYSGDHQRIEQLWRIYSGGIQHHTTAQHWSEWWTMWRRLAAGLDQQQQLVLYNDIQHALMPGANRKTNKKPKMSFAYEEKLRLAGVLERLPVANKFQLGCWLLKKAMDSKEPSVCWWALGRIGSRVLAYAEGHFCLSSAQVEPWIQSIIDKVDLKKDSEAAFALAMLCRYSGNDDISHDLRLKAADKLRQAKVAESWLDMVVSESKGDISESDYKKLWGETLPQGLILDV